jgi:hypothetical protein
VEQEQTAKAIAAKMSVEQAPAKNVGKKQTFSVPIVHSAAKAFLLIANSHSVYFAGCLPLHQTVRSNGFDCWMVH